MLGSASALRKPLAVRGDIRRKWWREYTSAISQRKRSPLGLLTTSPLAGGFRKPGTAKQVLSSNKDKSHCFATEAGGGT